MTVILNFCYSVLDRDNSNHTIRTAYTCQVTPLLLASAEVCALRSSSCFSATDANTVLCIVGLYLCI